MSIPTELQYTKSHEWVRQEADGSLSVGITHHAQELLGDMVFVENPVLGRMLAAGEECAVVESVKAASDIYAPVAGEVVAVNEAVEASPERINQDPYGAWMFRIRPSGELSGLLDATAYATHLETEAR
ncbi:MAG TPA: glycine cleavage system protein GcvH [Thiobacillaceae bacterium]|nr:glycine cleavage system protein GcvH [Thiobacillaceae bacterium]HNU63935.1 glycine cleavage system protein GcvH [Thiobacillaceae bacterium]